MARTRLTDLAIQKLAVPESGQKTYFEGHGFGVRVSCGGSKTFVQVYGKERRLHSLGRYPSIGLKQAREAAQRFLLSADSKRKPTTLSEARTTYYEEIEGRLRHATVEGYKLYLDRLDKEKLSDVTKADLAYSGHATLAAKVFFNWCIKNDLIDRNPVAHEKVTFGRRTRLITDDELKLIWAYEHSPFTDHVKLLFLTGQRRSQFGNFTIAGDTLRFPADVMKGKEDHTIPLLPLAKRYAEGLGTHNCWSKNKAKLDEKVPIEPWVLHDARRYFSSTMAKLRVPLHVTERIIAHRSGQVSGVAAIYNLHDFMEESREALAKYEAHIAALIAPAPVIG